MVMSSDNTERIGVNAVEAIFLSFDWVFRPQVISDYGIDAQVEVWEHKKFTGKLLALQIKSGASYFRKKGDDYVFYGEVKHLDYWTRHPLPVFIILHNPDNGLTLWQKVERRLAAVTDKGWSITIPAGNVLDAQSKHYLSEGIASDPESIRRFNFAFDLPTMRLLQGKDEIYFEINDWVNKSLNIRDVEVYFDERGRKSPDFVIPVTAPMRNYVDFMLYYFPWLDFIHLETEETASAEIEVHALQVWVNDLGKSYIAIEDFFVNGRPEPEEPDESENEEPRDEAEADWDAPWVADAIKRDQS